MTSKIELTFTQCKQLVDNGVDLREFVGQVNDQPEFMSDNTGMGIDSISELQSIIQSGCASNAHRAVYYHEASQCMGEHGDDVLEYIEGVIGELPAIPLGSSWSHITSIYLVTAIELWCSNFANDLDGVDWD